jgi:hypothetical protein
MVNFCVHKNLLFQYHLLSPCIVMCKIYLISSIAILLVVIVSNIGNEQLGWEIRSEFCRILRLLQFRTFWTPDFSSEFYFFIVKCVPANSALVFSGSESSPAIDCSDFMNRKTFPLLMSVASGIKF